MKIMESNKFSRLVRRGLITKRDLDALEQVTAVSGMRIEDALIDRGIPKHEVLFSLKEYYNLPFIEFDESVAASYLLIMRLDMQHLKQALWFPRSVRDNKAEVIACRPDDPRIIADVKQTLGVEHIDFIVALSSDLIRIIEHNFDVNPCFPKYAGRTPLAKVRTLLAEQRSLYSCSRTLLAKGRTGLAFLRTGLSFITIALVLIRAFGLGLLLPAEAALLIAGIIMTVDGIRWYMPARKSGTRNIACMPTEATNGSSVLMATGTGESTKFKRSEDVPGAQQLRAGWNLLSPVMRRRFLASDRTDFAEERTVLACYRTAMARARTGLSFMRTGVAAVGLGIALFRQFPTGAWNALDAGLAFVGAAMIAEGFFWYVPGRSAGTAGLGLVKSADGKLGIWDAMFPRLQKRDSVPTVRHTALMKGPAAPGIWATTGLALERTLLAERRNVMARLRTVMARSRTGMAFIRTGMSIAATGAGLLAFFGGANRIFDAFDLLLIAGGIAFIIDGLTWYLPAERTRRELPYCFGDLEIALPDYGVATRSWKKAMFDDDDL
jgi:uncharacterized membrane protein YidH (DUF202 family)